MNAKDKSVNKGLDCMKRGQVAYSTCKLIMEALTLC